MSEAIFPSRVRLRFTYESALAKAPLTGVGRGFPFGVSAAAIGVMAAVTFVLRRSALVSPFTVLLALLAAAQLIRFQVNPA